MDITILEDYLNEDDKAEAEKAKKNNSVEPNPAIPGEDETLTLTPDLPIMNFMPEQPIMLEQKIDIVVTVILNDPKIEKTVQTINTLCKNRKITSVTYAVSDVLNVDIFKAALEAQKNAQQMTSQTPPEEAPEPPKEESNVDSKETEETTQTVSK